MKVILRQNIETLGQIGDLVDVKEGYAVNYLIPRKYAYIALKGNIASLKEEKKHLEKKKHKEIQDAQHLAVQLEPVSVNIQVQVGEEDKLFGTVTTQMIADALAEKGFVIDKRKIDLPEQIKALGIYDVDIKLHASVMGKVKVWVVRE